MAPLKNVPNLTLNNNEEMPIIGIGTWKSKPGEVAQAVCDAIDAGYRHIDCAHVYENEIEVGKAIEMKILQGEIKRKDLFITSKLWNTFHRPDLVIPMLKQTLEHLRLKYLDLYLIHWPMAFKEEKGLFPTNVEGTKYLYSNVDYIDTWKQMEECVKLGLTKSIGLSNFNSQQIGRILDIATILPVTNQVECHPYLAQKELAKLCTSKGIVITGYSPLGSPDRPWAKLGDANLLEDATIKTVAKNYNKSPAQILIRYLIDRNISVIPKSVNVKRIKENINVFDFKLDSNDMEVLDGLNRNLRFVGCGMIDNSDHPYWPFHIKF